MANPLLEEKDQYYVVLYDADELKNTTLYFRDKHYPYYVECWHNMPTCSIEYHVIFTCTTRQSGIVELDLHRPSYLYFGR